ncbi:DUF4097 family beta strand repeat-containing protein [Roseisolibacter sp. H3M3-2]|uniref:DUF4097 family beta strand repeat-containing protein n=1 Tax=Roseisolibacter sp. H3M3-2 TaxID=3031323 RepID=UPI0023DB8606|nr:DUF4097 family beta strand repeat-containing protein [Roseisolibacter sp. H3M3-2]MDF1503125.1 DUF4097 family beta strand repeat-containing protein [Roseisolibacter sp. H3M3-2]
MRAPARRPAAALAAALLFPAAAGAQDAERFVLRGESPEVSHVVGRLRVVAGTEREVAVEVTRRGRDASRTAVERGTADGGREALRIFPREARVSYPGLGRNEVVHAALRDDGRFEGGWRGDGWRGRSVSRTGGAALEIRGDDRGVETWADVTVSVPAGGRVVLRLLAGEATVRDVDGDLVLDVETASASVQGTRGRLRVDAGSGELRLADARGDLDLDLGSGSTELTRVRAGTLRVDAGSGGVRGSDVEAASLDLDMGSGGTRLDGVRAARIVVDGGSGDVDLGLAANVEELRIDTGSGGVTLRVPDGFGATFDVDTGSGGFESELPVTYTRRERGRIAGRIGDGRGRIEVDTGSGGVRIRRR